jgi:DNA-binding NtrC family response regulator
MRISPDAMRVMVQAPWEGNVRELKNVIESLVVLAPEDEIRVEDLPAEYVVSRGEAAPVTTDALEPPGAGAGEGQPMTMDEIERRAILEALEKTGGNRTQAAEMLGIGLRTLQRKLKEYRLAGRADGK